MQNMKANGKITVARGQGQIKNKYIDTSILKIYNNFMGSFNSSIVRELMDYIDRSSVYDYASDLIKTNQCMMISMISTD